MSQYDAIIVGGGPAGLTAAIYLGRYLRPTLLLNAKEPTTRWHRPTARNVLGYPAGIMRSQLLEWGRGHVALYESVAQHPATVTQVTCEGNLFQVTTAAGAAEHARGLILATGVEYELPPLAVEGPGTVWDYAGHSIFHCPECDGYKVRGAPVAVLGHASGAAEMALELLTWTPAITLLTHGQAPEWGAEAAAKLAAQGIGVRTEPIQAVRGEADAGQITHVLLTDSSPLACQALFVNLPCDPPTELYAQLGLDLHRGRWVKVDHRQRTNVPRCYAAGDICAYSQTQLAVAMGQGATAAIWLHKELLPEERRLES